MQHKGQNYCRTRLVGEPTSDAAGISKPYLLQNDFIIQSCVGCYHYLSNKFQEQSRYFVEKTTNFSQLIIEDSGSSYYNNNNDDQDEDDDLSSRRQIILRPHSGDESAMASVCSTIVQNPSDCRRFRDCCSAAKLCCDSQIAQAVIGKRTTTTTLMPPPIDNNELCPMTWDGYSCFQPTPSGQTATISCPSFISNRNITNDTMIVALKSCDASGTWFRSTSGSEFTDYAACLSNGAADEDEMDEATIIFKLVCESISVLLLATSLFVFIYCRRLRRIPVYRVHINMFSALLLYSISSLLFDSITTFADTDELSGGCKVLAILTRLLMNQAYLLMTVEAVFDFWMLIRALHPLTHLKYPLLAGWCVPVVTNSIYVGLRMNWEDTVDPVCWTTQHVPLDWLIFAPNLACLAVNVLLLLGLLPTLYRLASSAPIALQRSIERRFTSSSYLPRQSNAPNPARKQSFLMRRMSQISSPEMRRTMAWRWQRLVDTFKSDAFRSMVVFTLLFGIPQLPAIYTPSDDQKTLHEIYVTVTMATQLLQGAFSSILLCFLNAEARSALRQTPLGTWLCVKVLRRQSSTPSITTVTTFTSSTPTGGPQRRSQSHLLSPLAPAVSDTASDYSLILRQDGVKVMLGNNGVGGKESEEQTILLPPTASSSSAL